MHPTGMLSCFTFSLITNQPTKLWKGNVFTGVCLSTRRAGRPPSEGDPPRTDIKYQVAATKADSMHPTGIHSGCACYVFDNRITGRNVDKLITILSLIRLTRSKIFKTEKNSQCLKLPMS